MKAPNYPQTNKHKKASKLKMFGLTNKLRTSNLNSNKRHVAISKI